MEQYDLMRHIISECDDALRDVFIRRMEASQRIAQAKMDSGEKIYDEERETSILAHVYSGFTSELANKLQMLWTSILRMSRGRQYRYFVSNKKDLVLAHDADLVQEMPDDIVLCPEDIARTVSTTLNMEVSTCHSIQAALDGLMNGTCNYAAVQIAGLYDAEWLYSMIFEKSIYVNSMTYTQDGTMIVLLSRKLFNDSKNGIVSIAFSISMTTCGSLSQALSVLADNRLSVMFMRFKTQNIAVDDQKQINFIFLDFEGSIDSLDTRAALFQLQEEMPFFRVIGYRPSVD